MTVRTIHALLWALHQPSVPSRTVRIIHALQWALCPPSVPSMTVRTIHVFNTMGLVSAFCAF